MQSQLPGARSEASAASLGILIVDDEPDMRTLLTIALQTAGRCTVTEAGSAQDALRAVAERPTLFDVVLLDIQMPQTTGIEICRILRATPGYADVPIVMLTAMTEHRFLHAAFVAGANDYISKPFDLDDVKKRVSRERLVGQRRIPLKAGMAGALGVSDAAASKEVIRDLEDAIAFPKTDRFVTREAFETFILQSAKQGGSALTLRAVKVAGVFDVFSRLDPQDFQAVIEEVARLISELTADSEDILTHLGNGIFFTARPGKGTFKADALSVAMANSTRLRDLSAGADVPRIVVGDPIDVSGDGKTDILTKLSHTLETAERAEEKTVGWSTFREWMSLRKSMGQARARLDRSTYESLLDDYVEKGELGWR